MTGVDGEGTGKRMGGVALHQLSQQRAAARLWKPLPWLQTQPGEKGRGPGSSFPARRLLRASASFWCARPLGPPPGLLHLPCHPSPSLRGLCAGAVPAGARWGSSPRRMRSKGPPPLQCRRYRRLPAGKCGKEELSPCRRCRHGGE